MLRITITDGPAEQRWILQGRLVAPWVAELEARWKNSHRRRDARKCIVDVSDVTLIDDRGEKALLVMASSWRGIRRLRRLHQARRRADREPMQVPVKSRDVVRAENAGHGTSLGCPSRGRTSWSLIS